MAQSRRFQWTARLACAAALGLAFASEGRLSTPSGAAPADSRQAPVSLLAQPGTCKPGFLEQFLNEWLDSAKDSDFESDYAAMAFDELVQIVYVLRDIAQDFCV